ncbi:uncharacterized protein [Primulina eburnea]|uniref:uncharacterized protein n=1 Tax=Primulina eburnea TaxID=1245227 RepID=UPI003C6C78C6
MPLENPLLGDDPEWSEPLGDDDKDALSGQDVGSLREVLGIPPECDIKFPGPRDDCHNPPPGYFTLFLEYFTWRLMFPLQPLLVELVKSLGDRFDLATIRVHKTTLGRQSPLAGNSIAPADHAAHYFRDTMHRRLPPARSEHVRGSGSNSQNKSNSSPSNKFLEIRPLSGGGGEANKRGYEGVEKKMYEETQKNPKETRVNDQGTASKTPSVKHIYVDRVNHNKKADSLWDLDDLEIGWKKGQSIVGEYVMVRLVSLSTDSFAHSLAWNSCQSLSLASAVQVREEKLRNYQDNLREEVARLKEEKLHLTQEK